MNAKSVQVVEDDVTTLPLHVPLAQSQQCYAQLRHQPAVAREEGATRRWGYCWVGRVTITESALATLVQVGKEYGKGIGFSKFAVVGDGFPNGEHQQVAVLGGGSSVHVYQD